MNVKDLLTSKNISYKESGADLVVKCLNDDHDDRNPSMRIDRILGIFRCVSCGFKGNIFKLLGEPPDMLAQKREIVKRKINDIRISSGLSLPVDAVPFEQSWRGISAETYKNFEAFKSAEPHFIGRVVFPIRDITGKIVVFQGRDETNTAQKKYLNYPANTRLPLFPNVTPIKDSVILVEGIFDMLNLHDKGLTNTICVFGVDTFNESKAINLKFQGIQSFVIMLDSDEAGEKGTRKIKGIAEGLGLNTRVVTLPENTDPGDLNVKSVQNLKKKLYG